MSLLNEMPSKKAMQNNDKLSKLTSLFSCNGKAFGM